MTSVPPRQTPRPFRGILARAGAGAALALAAACGSSKDSISPPTPAVLSRSYALYQYDGAVLPHAVTYGGAAGQLVGDTVRVWTNGSITGASWFQPTGGASTMVGICESEGTVVAPPFGTVDFGTALGRGLAGEDTVKLTTGTAYPYGKNHALVYIRITEGTDPAFVCQ